MFTFLEEWNRLTERIGFWIDLDHAYRTLDESYIESVWWALAQIDERGLLYEGRKVVPYCPRCETTLSSHEVALGYQDVVDESVFLKLPVLGERGAAAGVDDDAVDAARKRGASRSRRRPPTPRCGSGMIISCLPRIVWDRCSVRTSEIVERFSGVELVERYGAYQGPIFARDDREPRPAADPGGRAS